MLRHESPNANLSRLSDSVCTVTGSQYLAVGEQRRDAPILALSIERGVPVAVVEDDRVGSLRGAVSTAQRPRNESVPGD